MKSSKILLTSQKIPYALDETNEKHAMTLNESTVLVRYNKIDTSYIYIYSKDEVFLTKIKREIKIHMAKINQTEIDLDELKKRKKFNRNLRKIITDKKQEDDEIVSNLLIPEDQDDSIEPQTFNEIDEVQNYESQNDKTQTDFIDLKHFKIKGSLKIHTN